MTASAPAGAELLAIRDLRVTFRAGRAVGRDVHAVRGADLSVAEGETLAVVGESGSGKSVTMMAALGLLPENAEVAGSIRLRGRELLAMDERALRSVRGAEIGVIFQDPMSSLNPVHTVSRQISEAIRAHADVSRGAAHARAVELLGEVGIPDPRTRADDYPHQFSGGMRQRVMIAMALACGPRVLVADEPTTALDVTVQAQIVDLVDRIRRDRGMAVIWISHDLGVVAQLADRVTVMYAGRVVEQAPCADLFTAAVHPYTAGLLRAMPRLDAPAGSQLEVIPGGLPDPETQPEGCVFAPRCDHAHDPCAAARPALLPLAAGGGHAVSCHRSGELSAGGGGLSAGGGGPRAVVAGPLPARVGPTLRAGTDNVRARDASAADAPAADAPAPAAAGLPADAAAPSPVVVALEDLRVHYRGRSSWRRPAAPVRAVDGVSLELERGRTLGLVGESGSGKSTLARALLGLEQPSGGTVAFGGRVLDSMSAAGLRELRRTAQMVFQDPAASMNPALRVEDVVAEPLRINRRGTAAEQRARAAELLEVVELPRELGRRYPHQLSGGQRQRVAIARGLALDPEVLVCDEPVSALDVSVQAQIITLLSRLQVELGLSLLVISHDLAVIRTIAHRVAVMYLGQIVELGGRDDVFGRPRHPYTRGLLDAVPVPDPHRRSRPAPLAGDPPSPVAPPPGCRFHERCAFARPGLCDTTPPPLEEQRPGHWTACHLADEIAASPAPDPAQPATV
ncbi:ABC transporter ATP-binding protein [Jiangella sp. DSM 45060]|uniref:ABC transporter ATP-binding protein n=1 Tax=Jiangella sp. DSM 45060 TaxID=1798224 RepID=UPI00087AFE58|nr:ABC transporter ATP-binding protein [Jiangella sp. DSM 45060]SDS56332.1 peptide/nickel transport system ATP-binding protein [Jiangella sp. DSM 45060]